MLQQINAIRMTKCHYIFQSTLFDCDIYHQKNTQIHSNTENLLTNSKTHAKLG